MRLTPKNARSWNVFALLILGLAVSVFAWGLRYKLSLYESAPPAANHVTLAKLLSNRERAADAVVQIERATTSLPAVICVAFALFASFLLDSKWQSRWVLQRGENRQRRPIPEAARHISFRPPPSHSK